MDVARFIIRASCALVINEVMNILINDKMFRVKLIE